MKSDNNSPTGIGLSQPGSDLGQLPPIHTPQSFHAPDAPAAHFDAAPTTTSATPAPIAQNPVAPAAAVHVAPASTPPTDPMAQHQATMPVAAEAPAEDVDTAFDEEWVGKAREVIARTHEDPFMQSQALGKLKAQYVKARYNKDIKIGDA